MHSEGGLASPEPARRVYVLPPGFNPRDNAQHRRAFEESMIVLATEDNNCATRALGAGVAALSLAEAWSDAEKRSASWRRARAGPRRGCHRGGGVAWAHVRSRSHARLRRSTLFCV